MFGPKITTVFQSRWKALFWSSSMLLTAYCTVPSAEETKEKQDNAASATAAEITAKSPWAPDTK
jgi:hypothetical protein